MKIKEFLKKSIAITFAAALLMSADFGAFAVGEEGNDPDVVIDDGGSDTTEYSEPEQADDEPEVETDGEEYSEPVEDTEAPTDTSPAEEDDEYDDPAPETQAEPATVEEPEDDEEDYVTDTEPVATQKPVHTTGRAAAESKIPTSISNPQGEDGDLTYGYVSWACVIVGVIVVLIVLVSNKTRYYGGEGKHRYGEGNRITGQQKRLLDDDYYKTRKYNSYYSKDTRK